jgi:hypothetical protein
MQYSTPVIRVAMNVLNRLFGLAVEPGDIRWSPVLGILKRIKQTQCKVIKVLYSVSFKNVIPLDQKAVIITFKSSVHI